MSDEYCGRIPALNSVSDRFEEGRKAGRAEAEAKIAALQIRIAELERELDATPASGEPARKP